MAKKEAVKPHTKKIRTMALSLLIAAAVWVMVMTLTNPTTTTTVSNLRVVFIGEDQLRSGHLAVTGRAEIPSLSVTVRGSRSDLMNFMDDIYVQVDVSDITEKGSYDLNGTISIPTTRITVENNNFETIPITVEPLVSKDVEVTVKQTGALKGKLVETEVINPVVPLTGAESEMNEVAGASVTVDISNADKEQHHRASYVLTDKDGALITDNETIESARAEVEVLNKIYTPVTLPVEPVLSEEMNDLYTINKEKTTVSPSSVTVGVNDMNYANVKLIVDRVSEGEQEYFLRQDTGMYIPEAVRSVKAHIWLDSKQTNAPEGEEANAG